MSIAAPGAQGDSFILNMATTAVSLKKPDVKNQKDIKNQKDKDQKGIKNQKDKDQKGIKNQKDKDQKDVRNQDAPKQPEEKRVASLKEMDADVSYETACLLPAVGPEGAMGYTGYGLGLVVETFCGILADAHHGLKGAPKGQEAVNLGQCFVAVNPAHFAPGFEERLSNFLCSLRSQEQEMVSDLLCSLMTQEPNEVENPVLVPGDPEKIHMRLVDRQGGVSYSDKQYKTSRNPAMEPYRLSGHRLLAKMVSTSKDEGCHFVSTAIQPLISVF
ncbi:unnamed protein product [Timema podura]|uniref:Uncharacterized protein n=1 Tax=Timema podura TaxID=61482 RepID=A0ABN7PF42_TIMPD|nr:unnamed protein product [Timema podura]